MTYGDACNGSVKEIGRTCRLLIGQRNVVGENTGELWIEVLKVTLDVIIF